MTRLIRGSVLLAACVGLWSCGTDSTSSEAGVPYKIVSLPSVVFIKTDSSQLISFQLVDELDGQIPTTWTLTSTSPNFTVALDSSYRVVYNSDGTLTLPDSQTQVRATITGTNLLGISEFTVSAGGKTLTIPVNTVPGTLYATFSPANPAPGQTVTMTMPPSLRLTPASKIGFPGNNKSTTDTSSIRNLVIAPDSMSATFIAAPTVDTVARVTNVYNTEFPTLAAVTLNTQTKVTGTQSGTWNGQLPATLSPLVAGQMTATLNPAYAYKCNPTCGNTTPSVFSFPTQTAPIVVSVSADSTVATLAVGPNVSSVLQVTRVTFKGAPMFEYQLVSADEVNSSVVSSFPATLSNYTPQIGESVVFTAGAGFSLGSTAVATWPLVSGALVQARTANSMTIQPAPGSAGSPSAVTGVISASAPAFQLTIPAVLSTPLAMQATATSMAGTGATGTAPTVPVAPVGQAFGFYDGYTVPTQYYKFDVLVTTTLKTTINWSNGADIDVAWYTAAGAYLGYFGAGTGAQPEVSTHQFAPGSYLIGPEIYAGAQPAWVSINIETVSTP